MAATFWAATGSGAEQMGSESDSDPNGTYLSNISQIPSLARSAGEG